jgi:hypothetical protein
MYPRSHFALTNPVDLRSLSVRCSQAVGPALSLMLTNLTPFLLHWAITAVSVWVAKLVDGFRVGRFLDGAVGEPVHCAAELGAGRFCAGRVARIHHRNQPSAGQGVALMWLCIQTTDLAR